MARRRRSQARRPGVAGPTFNEVDRLNPPIRPIRFDLRLIEDRRRFHPERDLRPALSISRLARRLVERLPRPKRMAPGNPRSNLRSHFAFHTPSKVVKCVRRKERREVIFAERKSGKGSRALRRRRDYWSDVSCR